MADINNQLDLFSPDDRLRALTAEYFFLISPPDEIKARINILRNQIVQETNFPQAKRFVPHISLFKLECPSNDIFIIKAATVMLAKFKAFQTIVKNHEVYIHGKSSKSLVLEFEDPAPIVNIYGRLLNLFVKKIRHSFRPHLTIAKEIPLGYFSKIKDLAAYNYKAAFDCSEIIVWKKFITDQDSSYTKLHTVLLGK